VRFLIRVLSSLKAEINFSCCFVFKVRLSKVIYIFLFVTKTWFKSQISGWKNQILKRFLRVIVVEEVIHLTWESDVLLVTDADIWMKCYWKHRQSYFIRITALIIMCLIGRLIHNFLKVIHKLSKMHAIHQTVMYMNRHRHCSLPSIWNHHFTKRDFWQLSGRV
jgi:hypothetical protein